MIKQKIIAVLSALILTVTIVFLISKYTSEQKDVPPYIIKLQKEATQGNAKAMHLLAIEYEKGRAIPKDLIKAKKLLENSADQEFGNALIDLGRYHYHGITTPENHNRARSYYNKAETLQDIVTLHNLGLLYYQGKHVKQDYAKAFKLFSLVTEKEEFKSKNYKTETRQTAKTLGIMYMNGQGTIKNLQKANNWLAIAAEYGDKKARDYLETQKTPPK